MALISRSVISKAIFSISVVAITGSVGIVGFAQAARNPHVTNASSNGYGGTGAQVQAAVDAFQASLAAATTKFQADVNSCVKKYTSGIDTIDNTFNQQTTSDASDFSAATANPTAFDNDQKFDSHFKVASTTLQTRLDSDGDKMVGDLDRSGRATNLAEFHSCMKTARSTFNMSLSDARKIFRTALHNIFHA
jgi:hypothetical protein